MTLTLPPRALPANALISPYSRNSLGTTISAFGQGMVPVSAAYVSANLRFYYPFTLWRGETLNKFWWANGGTVGTNNLQCAVYRDDLTLVLAGTSTLSATANVVQEDDVADTYLAPGHYYMSIACNGTTATLMRGSVATASIAQMMGFFSQASAFSPPDPMVPANVGANSVIYVFGLAFRTVAA